VTPPPLPSFVAARLPVAGERVLIVAVARWVLDDPATSQLYVQAFQRYFRRTIILMAQDPLLVPTYFGPAPMVRELSRLPFELIPWRRFVYRQDLAQRWWLPVPAPPSLVCTTEP
jgi:hypothetical protein